MGFTQAELVCPPPFLEGRNGLPSVPPIADRVGRSLLGGLDLFSNRCDDQVELSGQYLPPSQVLCGEQMCTRFCSQGQPCLWVTAGTWPDGPGGRLD